jgi:branched-chain amino acid transport system ATP-binding protein
MSEAVPALRITGLAKNFGGLAALDDVSFAVAQGDVVGLIGPNGAGKSTLFELVGGAQTASRGKIEFFGADITRMPPHERRRAGLCRTFQKIRLFPTLTVKENVAVAAMRCARPGQSWRDAVDAVLKRLKLQHNAHRRPAELTLADRKKVEIARALAGFCRVLMLDESLSGLTHDEAQELVAEVLALNRRDGLTIVVVEHVMSVVVAMANRLVVLQQGRVIADGVPGDIVRNPRVIEAYLGTKRQVFT